MLFPLSGLIKSWLEFSEQGKPKLNLTFASFLLEINLIVCLDLCSVPALVGLSTLSFAAHTHKETHTRAVYIFKHVLSLLRANFDDVGPIKTASK